MLRKFDPETTPGAGSRVRAAAVRAAVAVVALAHRIPGVARLSARIRDAGLSGKLLGLTVMFVMLAEVLIFVPSIANYRTNWLNDRLSKAHLAALAAEGYPGGLVPDSLRDEMLRSAGVRMVAVKRNDQRQLILREPMETGIDATYDFRMSDTDAPMNPISWFKVRGHLIADTLDVFFAPDHRYIRVLGKPAGSDLEFVEIVMTEAPLKLAMWRHAFNILILSILISALAGGLVYLALRSLFVEPLQRMSENMVAFSARPEDTSRIIAPSNRGDEIGTAERELAHMQGELNQMLAQKTRLAALGLAVSKINHDMRNMLATAQLLSDNLTSVNDPRVQKFAPKLIASLDRAINFCNDTLKFGRAAESAPRRDLFALRPLVEEVGDGLNLPHLATVAFRVDVPPDLKIDADREHLYRVLANIARNGLQAIEAQSPARSGTVTIRATRFGARVVIDVIDDGPGLATQARDHLFEAFQGSTRRGGTGLGLAIAQELVTAHGGALALVEADPTGGSGCHFRIEIPDRA